MSEGATLFAALDAGGSIRFVDEVARGRACGCRCPVCGSPLIARQGEIQEWNFAHEPGQDRPECRAGAVNLLRRLAIEWLRDKAQLRQLPQFQALVEVGTGMDAVADIVTWHVRPAAPPVWLPQPAHDAPVARMRSASGVDIELLVLVGDQPAGRAVVAPGVAVLAFWCPLAPASQLRDRESVLSHIVRRGVFLWQTHPDLNGQAQALRERLELKLQHRVEQRRRRQLEEHREAGRRWAHKQALLQQRYQAPAEQEPVRAPAPATDPGPADESYPWAPGRKRNGGFVYYRLRDGSAWVLYEMVDGRCGLAPWPMFEGWDEALPPVAGEPDPERGIFVGEMSRAMAFLRDKIVHTRTGSRPQEFLAPGPAPGFL